LSSEGTYSGASQQAVEPAAGNDTGDTAPAWSPSEQHLIDDASYVAREIMGGTVVVGDAFQKALPFVSNLLAALGSCQRVTHEGRRETDAYAADKGNDPPLVALDKALGALMAQISPVTIQSLRDTQWAGSGAPGLGFIGYVWQGLKRAFAFGVRRGHESSLAGGMASLPGEADGKYGSLADRFSDKLLYFTLLTLFAALVSSILSVQPHPGAPNTQAQPKHSPPPNPAADPSGRNKKPG
jgi:hypothetical protein